MSGVKCLAFLLCLGACDLSDPPPDDRPQTLEFITEAILKPSCGTAECHSAFKKQSTDVFDSVEGARGSFDRNPSLVVDCAHVLDAAGNPNPQPNGCVQAVQQSYLVQVIDPKQGTIEGNVMPYDQALSNSDYILISDWITNGAHGYTVKDAP